MTDETHRRPDPRPVAGGSRPGPQPERAPVTKPPADPAARTKEA